MSRRRQPALPADHRSPMTPSRLRAGAGRGRPALHLRLRPRRSRPGRSSPCRSARGCVIGAVWHDAPDEVAPKKLREIERIFDAPPLPDALIRFVDWVADYTLAPRGMVLRMVLALAGGAGAGKADGRRAARRPAAASGMTAARKRVLDAAADGLAWSKSGLAGAAGVSTGVVDGLARRRHAGARRRMPATPDRRRPRSRPRAARSLGGAGAGAAAALRRGRAAATSPSRCSTASPARARPRSISRRSPRRCGAASRR